MDRDKRFEFYEKQYFHELDAREKIEARLRTPLTMFAVIFGLLAFITNEVPLNRAADVGTLFWALYLLGGTSFVVSLWFFIRAVYGYHYLLLPTSDALEEYIKQIEDKYCKTDRGKAKAWAAEAFSEYLFDCYVEYTTRNTQNNDSKSLNLSRCIGALITSFVLSCLSYVSYYYQQILGGV